MKRDEVLDEATGQRECDDAEWNDDPRLAYLARELEYFKELDKAGVVYEPKF